MGYRVRDAIAKKIPYICVIGKKEISDSTVSVRKLGENKSTSITIDDLIRMMRDDVAERR